MKKKKNKEVAPMASWKKMWNSERMQPGRMIASPGMLKNIKGILGKEPK